MAPFENLAAWIEKYPALAPVVEKKPTIWLNSDKKNVKDRIPLPLGLEDMEQGRAFMEKYASYIAQIFPATAATGGLISSPLREIDQFRKLRNEKSLYPVSGRLLLKCDHALPVAGSIKARGGFFEVLQFAHKLSVQHGLIEGHEAADFSSPACKALFEQYTIGVGSTGNLGLSIGIISARLGFRVKVYMSRDAKEWKKKLLRENGATVIESKGDFGVAITAGRKETLGNPYGYFVDDENSSQLFLGYSLAAFEVQKQLAALQIRVDAAHPLFLYQPCGVGGSPGGVLFGLKMLYGDAVHAFFAEPTHSPAVLIGLITEKREKVSVQDFGLDNITEADGLAVGRPSAFASGIIKKLVSGIYTLEDDALFALLQELYQTEGIFIEPSAAAGLIGPEKMLTTNYLAANEIDPSHITHIAWSTGGDLVPEEIRELFLARKSA